MEWENARFEINKDLSPRSFKVGKYWVENVYGDENGSTSVVIRRGKDDYCNIQSPDYLRGLEDAGVLVRTK